MLLYELELYLKERKKKGRKRGRDEKKERRRERGREGERKKKKKKVNKRCSKITGHKGKKGQTNVQFGEEIVSLARASVLLTHSVSPPCVC